MINITYLVRRIDLYTFCKNIVICYNANMQPEKNHSQEPLEDSVCKQLASIRKRQPALFGTLPIQRNGVRHAIRLALIIAKETGMDIDGDVSIRILAKQQYILCNRISQSAEKNEMDYRNNSPSIQNEGSTGMLAANDLDEYNPDQDFGQFWK